MSTTPGADLVRRIPPTWLVVGGIISVQVGAAVAKDLFTLVPPTAMTWLRLTFAAIILLLVARPRLRGRSRRDWLVMAWYGLMLLGMNWAIYQSFARIPLGVAVTIEFSGPLLLAVIGSRRLLDVVWVVLAGAGVALLGLGPVAVDWIGIGFALLAGACWAGYIVAGARLGRQWSGVSGLAMGSLLGAVLLAPAGVIDGGAALLNPTVLGLALIVALVSSVIPYSLELVALRRIPPRVFGILMSLEPGAAALAGALILRELLAPLQWLAVALVVGASIGASRGARRARARAEEVGG
ncbi:EamA family transporter [Microlunatus sp. Y2014]|uniref:EamA family transporter n=1 Tax=Microlunatus sp. Y2014 TaxID=3418488 RepID=UPI003DA7453E